MQWPSLWRCAESTCCTKELGQLAALMQIDCIVSAADRSAAHPMPQSNSTRVSPITRPVLTSSHATTQIRERIVLSYSELRFAKTRHCTPRLIRKCKLTCHRQTRSAQSDAQSAFRATLAPRPSCASMGHRRCTYCTLAASMEQTAAAMNEYVRTFHPIHEAIPSEMRSARWHQVELDHEGYSPLSRTSGGAAGAASTLW